jgi:hypothetical protein
LAIFKRFPAREQVAAVYAVIVLVIYSWTILWFFWKLPSWLYFLSIWEIAKVLCYSITINFLESLVVLAPSVFLAVILPKQWFLDGFISRSVTMILIGLVYMMYLSDQFHGMESYPAAALNLAPIILLAILLAVLLVGKISFLRKLIEGFADRATVFLYISIPISLVCLLVVLVQLII